jgi:hypothetical protein
MAGVFAVALVVVFSVLQLTSGNGGHGNAGVPAGAALRTFAAPLATSTLEGDTNLDPPCSAAHHDPRALNICLLARRSPLVLSFFSTDAGSCERSVDALQRLARRTPGVAFAAVAIRASHASARAAVRRHGWTIPVAYDRDGALGETLGIAVCPLLELVRRGGVVARRLVGDRWGSASAIAGQLGVLGAGR